MHSARRPKRLEILGSLGQESLWLAKSGEDLRMDQRIQQQFEFFNGMFRHNSYCLKHSITLETYRVVPMSHMAGLISWVPKTMPLSSCYKMEDGFSKNASIARKGFEKMLTRKRKSTNFTESKYYFYTKCTMKCFRMTPMKLLATNSRRFQRSSQRHLTSKSTLSGSAFQQKPSLP